MSVYFITCREANAVKIGNSVDPSARVGEIQWGCPLQVRLEALWPGGAPQERELHRRFADDRIRGEWFKITPMIEAVMAASPAPLPTPAQGRSYRADQIKVRCRPGETPEERRERKLIAMAKRRHAEAAWPEIADKLNGGGR